MRKIDTERCSTRWAGRLAFPALLLLGAGLLAAFPSPAVAGVRVGITAGGPGFSLSFGVSSYPIYSPAWGAPSLSLSFETTLAGYGEWVTIGGLGRVWRPWVAPGWRPYTWGRWVYTAYGWTWVSYEPWGYVPHHYGSWAMSPYGWVWVPGFVYRPAHVTWVRCGAYVGWYPVPPPGWSQVRRAWWNGYGAGHRDGYRSGYGHGYADGWRDARYATFVPWNRITADNIATVAVAGSRLPALGPARVRVLPAAPSRVEVQRYSGRTIPTVRVSERMVSMGGRTVRAVRPAGVERSIAAHSRTTVHSALRRSSGRALRPSGAMARRTVPGRAGRSSRTATTRSARRGTGRATGRPVYSTAARIRHTTVPRSRAVTAGRARPQASGARSVSVRRSRSSTTARYRAPAGTRRAEVHGTLRERPRTQAQARSRRPARGGWTPPVRPRAGARSSRERLRSGRGQRPAERRSRPRSFTRSR